jgi:hypothetical protein
MKLTPFGFVSQTEGFLREALSLPPVGGGSWSLQRVINFTDQAGALQVLLNPESGPQKVRMTFHARQTGSFKDSGIQGWIEFNDGASKDPFVLKQTNSTRSAEEIFDIVDRALTHLPEWDNSSGMSAPPPAPHSGAGFAPLIPSSAPAATDSSTPENPQSFIDSIFGGNTAETPVPAPTESSTPEDPQSFIDSIFGGKTAETATPVPEESTEPPADAEPAVTGAPEATVESPVAEETPETTVEAEASDESPAKKAKAPKAKKASK